MRPLLEGCDGIFLLHNNFIANFRTRRDGSVEYLN
jgi:hypothetical protein